ncbi:hypothetical protein [Aquimarina aggregata]|nr:hypothetical protein [Aquimarina aggregata]
MRIKIERIEIKFKKWWHGLAIIMFILLIIFYPLETLGWIKEVLDKWTGN